MTNIYSKKCKIAFWPVFALTVLCCSPSESGGGSEGRVSACVLSVALHAEIHVIGDPRALNKSSIRKGSWRQLSFHICSEVSGESWSYRAHSSSKGSFLSSVLLLESELFWLSDFCMFLVSPVQQDKYFHFLCIVHNSSYSQFSNSRFLKETKYCRIKFNTIRIPSRKKIPTSPPPNRKAHFNKKYIPTSCFPYICLIAKYTTL